MSQPERVEVLILGSGEGGKKMAWHMARSGRRTAVVERKWIGGSCRNIACLPSKNEIWSARVAHLARHAAQFGTMISGPPCELGGSGRLPGTRAHRRTSSGRRAEHPCR